MKTCRICDENKDLAEFGALKVRKDGLNSMCKVCAAKKMREHKAKNPEQTKINARKSNTSILGKERGARFRAKHRDRINAEHRAQSKTPKAQERVRKYRLKNKDAFKVSQAEYYKNNKEAILARTSAWQKANPEKVSARNKAYRERHPERVAEHQKKYLIENKDARRERGKEWKANNKAKVNESTARRRATKRNATPKWANVFFMREIYDLARLRSDLLGVDYEVDHIIPMSSKVVCGLHVEHNLQILTAQENKIKSNIIWENM